MPHAVDTARQTSANRTEEVSDPMPSHRTTRLGALLVGAVFILAACGGQTQSPAESARATDGDDEPTAIPSEAAGPDLLKVATTAAITTWDPVASFSTEAFYMANIYEPLLRVNPPDSAEEFTPVLAETWEASDDGLTWTFNLRDGVTFHDGEAMNADAVVASIEAAKERAGASFIWLPLESIEAVDELTVEMTLAYAAPMDLVASSLYGAWIVSPAALEAAAADETYFEDGVDGGTGPYTIDSYTPGEEVVLTAYEDYWGGWGDLNHYETVLITITPEAVVQQEMLEGGDVDLAFSVPLENIERFRDNPDFTFLEEPSFFNYVGLFNTQRAPLDDPLIRQALSYALPYDDIIQAGAAGFGTQSRGPVPQGVFPWSEDVPQYEQDLDKARDLLAEAGYEDGFSLEMTYASENQNEERFAPIIADAFAEIGVEVEITPMLFSQQWERAKGDPEGRQDLFLLLYWPTYSDAGSDNLWSLFRSSEAPFFNLSYWVNEDYDALIDEAGALTATDRDAAQEAYTEAMQLLVDQAPGLFFYDTKAVFAIPNHIAGFDYNLNYPFAQFFYPLHPAE